MSDVDNLTPYKRLQREEIFEAAEEAGFKRMDSCCNTPLKTCSADEWKGNLSALVVILEKKFHQKQLMA